MQHNVIFTLGKFCKCEHIVCNLKVRWSACHSLQMLTSLSLKFAGEALKLLMDVLNDDSVDVRLRALEAMHYMATCDHLKVQETHMHMVNF